MIILASTSDKLSLVSTSTGVLHVHASWVDRAAGPPEVITPGRTNTAAINTATTTDIVAAPAAATVRNVQTLNIRLVSGASQTVTIKHTDGTNNLELFSYTMAVGEHIQFIDGEGFQVFDAAGGKKAQSATGRFLRTTVLINNGNHTVLANATSIFVRMVGGGAGGGGCTSVAAAASAAGGGGAGGYAEKLFAVVGGTAYAYVVGPGGVGQSALAGANGSDSTFIVGATTVTAKGGTGAAVATALTTLSAYVGGSGGVQGTNGDINAGGESGSPGVVLIVATPILASGNGGSTQYGAGGKGLTAVGNGNPGVGFGGGGGGAATGASAVRTGGSGSPGTIIVDEYS